MSLLILGLIQSVIIPTTVSVADFFERLFTNSFGLPFNSGAFFFLAMLIMLIYAGLAWTSKNGKTLANTAILSIALVLMGMIVFVAGVSFLFARLVKAVLQKARKEKRKHIGYQIVFWVLFSIISHFARENQSVNDLLMSGGDEYFSNIYTVAIFTAICILTGSVIGYFITPIEHLEKN